MINFFLNLLLLLTVNNYLLLNYYYIYYNYILSFIHWENGVGFTLN